MPGNQVVIKQWDQKKIGARYPNGNKTVGREHTVTTWTPGTFFFLTALYICRYICLNQARNARCIDIDLNVQNNIVLSQDN